MTLQQFLDALATTPRDWRFYWGTMLRRKVVTGPLSYEWKWDCPLTAVADGFSATGVDRAVDAGVSLGLDGHLINVILNAADNYLQDKRFSMEEMAAVRAKLLLACGLTEEGKRL